MKPVILFATGLAGLVGAQSIGDLVAEIPSCAQAPLLKAIASASDCSATDYVCQCQPANKAKIQAAATGPISAACPASLIGKVLTVTTEICKVALASASSSAATSMAASKTGISSMAPSPSPSPSSQDQIVGLVSTIPACAINPLLEAIANSTSCTAVGYACQCIPSNVAKIQAAATVPIGAACSVDDVAKTLKITGEICVIAVGGSATTTSSPSASSYPTVSPQVLIEILKENDLLSECEQTCLAMNVYNASGCGLTDFVCQCQPTNQYKISKRVIPCLYTACNLETTDLPGVQVITGKICALADPKLAASQAAAAAAASSAAAADPRFVAPVGGAALIAGFAALL